MDYQSINKQLWNDLTGVHLTSSFYDVPGFIKGKSSLKDVELQLLGDISGKKILHLQCHFGMDTISFSRMGAHATGVDLSDRAISEAKKLALECSTNTKFIESDIYDLPHVHDDQYDIVFTSYGTIGWLPDMDKWAGVVQHFLKPGGRLVMVDFHPVIWMMSYDFTKIEYGYFNKESIVEETEGSYVDRNAPIKNKAVSWNHSLSEIIQSIIDQKMRMNHFSEYDYSTYDCFEHTVKIAEDHYQIKGLEGLLPMMYAIVAEK